MRYAILSDVHGRRPKLEAVLADALARRVQRILSLGDVGGDECVALLQHAGAQAVFGNYEVSGWQRLSAQYRDWVRSWPPILSNGDFLAVHAVPWWPDGLSTVEDFHRWLQEPGRFWRDLFPYLTDAEPHLWRAVAELASAGKFVLFHGHTHRQTIWRFSPSNRLECLRGMTTNLETGYLYLVGVGSVGLPEDGGWASYTLYDSDDAEIELVRLPIDRG
jgi:predicted phosphodiesterase